MIKPAIWGPELWKYLHIISLNYPENPTYMDINNYNEFYKYLAFTIPCDNCKHHYKKYITNNPPNLTSKNDLVVWTIEFHNSVNKRIGKPTYTIDEAMDLIQASLKKSGSNKIDNFAVNSKSKSNYGLIIFLILFTIAIIIIFYMMFKTIKSNRF